MRMIVLNRLGLDNFIQDIRVGMVFECQNPYIFFKSKKKVYCLWVYKKSECKSVWDHIKRWVTLRGLNTTQAYLLCTQDQWECNCI